MKNDFSSAEAEYLGESLLGAERTVSVGLQAQVVKPWEEIQPGVKTWLLVATAQNNLLNVHKFVNSCMLPVYSIQQKIVAKSG